MGEEAEEENPWVVLDGDPDEVIQIPWRDEGQMASRWFVNSWIKTYKKRWAQEKYWRDRGDKIRGEREQEKNRQWEEELARAREARAREREWNLARYGSEEGPHPQKEKKIKIPPRPHRSAAVIQAWREKKAKLLRGSQATKKV